MLIPKQVSPVLHEHNTTSASINSAAAGIGHDHNIMTTSAASSAKQTAAVKASKPPTSNHKACGAASTTPIKTNSHRIPFMDIPTFPMFTTFDDYFCAEHNSNPKLNRKRPAPDYEDQHKSKSTNNPELHRKRPSRDSEEQNSDDDKDHKYARKKVQD